MMIISKSLQTRKKDWEQREALLQLSQTVQYSAMFLCLNAWQEFEPYEVVATTYQAISGAGKTFADWPEMVENIIPYIGGEEAKSEDEPLKIWGHIENGKIVQSRSRQRLPASASEYLYLDGHTAAVFVKFKKKPTKEQLIRNSSKTTEDTSSGTRICQAHLNSSLTYTSKKTTDHRLRLTAATKTWYGCNSRKNKRRTSIYDFKFIGLAHNTVRGAAGGAILCAEALTDKGYITAK